MQVKFKTNIKCVGCIQTVTPFLEKVEGLEQWEVDLTSPDRVLTIEVDTPEVSDAVQDAIQKAGYKAEETGA
jgi:copper chaperone